MFKVISASPSNANNFSRSDAVKTIGGLCSTTISLEVAHAHVFPADILPSVREVAACEQSRFRTLGRDILQERRTKVPARVCHSVRHDWTLLTFDTRVMISTN